MDPQFYLFISEIQRQVLGRIQTLARIWRGRKSGADWSSRRCFPMRRVQSRKVKIAVVIEKRRWRKGRAAGGEERFWQSQEKLKLKVKMPPPASSDKIGKSAAIYACASLQEMKGFRLLSTLEKIQTSLSRCSLHQ